MKQTEILVEGIEYKVKKLIEQKRQLQNQNENLVSVVEGLKIDLKKKETEINGLEEKVKTIGLSKSLTTKQDKIEIHQRIDELVREIDKSISVLNSLNK